MYRSNLLSWNNMAEKKIAFKLIVYNFLYPHTFRRLCGGCGKQCEVVPKDFYAQSLCSVLCAKIWPLFSQIENWPHKLKRHKAFSNHFTTLPATLWGQNIRKFNLKLCLGLLDLRLYFVAFQKKRQAISWIYSYKSFACCFYGLVFPNTTASFWNLCGSH